MPRQSAASIDVAILGSLYSLAFHAGASAEHGLDEDDFGATHSPSRTIAVNTRYHETTGRTDEVGLTVIHECIHAALAESGVSELLDDRKGLEEAIVVAIENGLRGIVELTPRLRAACAAAIRRKK